MVLSHAIMSRSSLTKRSSVRWNDFENIISEAFKEPKEEKDFFDVTLACDDDQIQPHEPIPSDFSKVVKFLSLLIQMRTKPTNSCLC